MQLLENFTETLFEEQTLFLENKLKQRHNILTI